jgi:hypothetical protein
LAYIEAQKSVGNFDGFGEIFVELVSKSFPCCAWTSGWRLGMIRRVPRVRIEKKRICRAAALLARYVRALRVDALGRLGRTRASRAVFGGLAPWLLHANVLHYYYFFLF